MFCLNTLPPLIRIMLVAALLILLSTHSTSAHVTPPDMLAGETLYYTIDFWLFHGSATGELCFKKTPGGYTALFEAETRGVLRLIAGHRKEIMESIMEYDESRQRLRPLVFRETFIQNKMEYKRTLAFNYEKSTFTCTRTYPGNKTRTIQGPLPDTTFEDMLTFFYNFRMGCYGRLREGGRLSVPVLMKEQPSLINIDFTEAGSKKRADRFNAALTMDRTLTHARSKRVLLRINEMSIPESALVIDAYFFGELGVRLTGMTYHESIFLERSVNQ